jgi:outer membrane protein TolC
LIAQAEKGRAAGAVREAYAGALPNVSLQASYQRNFSLPAFYAPEQFDGGGKIEIGSDIEVQGGIRVDQTLYAFGRIGNAVDYAKIYRRIAGLGVERARCEVVFITRQAYDRVLLAQRLAGIRQRSLEQARAHLANVEMKFNQGTASRFELRRAQVEVRNREPEAIRAENDLVLARQDLARLIGLDPGSGLVLTDTLAYLPIELDLQAAIEEGFVQRPEIRTLEEKVAGQTKILSIYKAENLPILGFYGQVGLQGQTDAEHPFDPLSERNRAISTSVGLAISMPLFDGFRAKGRVQRAQADLLQAQHELERSRKQIHLEITKAIQEIQSLRREYQAQLATVDLAQETYAIAETRFQSGVSTQLELTDAETALDLARTSFAEVLYRYDVAIANLERVLGRTARIDTPLRRTGDRQEEE